MRKFIKQTALDVKNNVRPSGRGEAAPTSVSSPSTEEVIQYRYQHGTNVGAMYCLERWLFGSMFDEAACGGSELDAVQGSIKTRGLEATKAKWEAHWANAVTEQDLIWLTEVAHCNCLRLPIGYFTLGPDFCEGTPFAGEISQVYHSAWSSVCSLVSRCYSRGIGILIDLHAAPGGANDQEHSGTTTGKAALWGNKFNLDLATRCLTFIARETVQGLDGIIGLQLCNESAWDPPGMYDWYTTTIASVNSVNPTLPIYLSDAWDLPRALRYAQSKNSTQGPLCNPIIVDTHKYWAFTPADHAKSPQTIISEATESLSSTLPFTGSITDHAGTTSTFIGEYSCALNPSTWSHAPASTNKAPLTRQFGQAQTQTWHAHASGAAFWTFKMDWLPGGEWGFKSQTESGAITAPATLSLPATEIKTKLHLARAERNTLRDAAHTQHTTYWSRAAPGGTFEHGRYVNGWELGFDDAAAFFGARVEERRLVPGGEVEGADEIGALDLWVLKRMRDTGTVGAGFAWEWEHGFRKGVQDFGDVVGV